MWKLLLVSIWDAPSKTKNPNTRLNIRKRVRIIFEFSTYKNEHLVRKWLQFQTIQSSGTKFGYQFFENYSSNFENYSRNLKLDISVSNSWKFENNSWNLIRFGFRAYKRSETYSPSNQSYYAVASHGFRSAPGGSRREEGTSCPSTTRHRALGLLQPAEIRLRGAVPWSRPWWARWDGAAARPHVSCVETACTRVEH